MKKILYSPGWGAGWSTWNSGEVATFMLTYQPIIDFIETGGKFTKDEVGGFGNKPLHPLLQKLQEECKEKFGETYVCVLGARDLEVESVSGPFRVTEYDGNEGIEYRNEVDWHE